MKNYDIVILGAGHAGCEAAHIASQFGLSVCLVSLPDVGFASTPCNPSIGGVAKGQVVREIDVLGGLMAKAADLAAIQYRTLNESKGSAVQSTRVQVDKDLYTEHVTKILEAIENLTLIRDEVVTIEACPEGGFILATALGLKIRSQKLIVTAGTFLKGLLHFGPRIVDGGRVGARSSHSLTELFGSKNFAQLRFKTGTPARLLNSSLDFSVMTKQESDAKTRNFHLLHDPFVRHCPQICCYLTATNSETMRIIRANKDRSPIFNGQIGSIGPRYCPSIEDKANRYPDRDVHHVFIEPEGLSCNTIYPNGLSTSLPEEVQEVFLRTIIGLKDAKILTPGYAVEYDVIDTSQLERSLEHTTLRGLYFAGQINGTSGYEEAAGQGVVAGINAALAVLGRNPLFLSRFDSYIGVMIEDLVSNVRDEPYRLFTSRSESRLYLREDNVALRLAPYRRQLGLNFPIDRYLERFVFEFELLNYMCEHHRYHQRDDAALLERVQLHRTEITSYALGDLLKQSVEGVSGAQILHEECERRGLSFLPDVYGCVVISKRYEGYIRRSHEQEEKMRGLEAMVIDWQLLVNSKNISYECRMRIERVKPRTFGELRLIEGIRQATLAIVAGRLY